MQALGRILQVVGWLWFLAGIVGPIFGLDRFNFFPGLILIFVARVIRTQRGRREPAEPRQRPTQPETAPPDRILNTERRQQPSSPSPAPQPSAPSPSPEPTVGYPQPERTMQPELISPPSGEERSELLERIVAAGRDVGDEVDDLGEPPSPPSPGGRASMSSEEMIARARKRWDTKRR